MLLNQKNKQKKIRSESESGTMLVTLLVFVAVLITVVGGATAVLIATSQSTSKYSVGEQAFYIAEAGADNAVLRLLRDPDYSGETLTVGNGTATITVTGAATKTITSEGEYNEFKRKVEVVGTFTNDVFDVTSWEEID